MGIIDKIKEKIFGTKKLNSYNIDLSATRKLIPIGIIEEILNDDQMFWKFNNFEQNIDIFDSETTKEDYILVISDYINAKKNMGYKITDKEKKNFYLLTGEKIKKTLWKDKGQRREEFNNGLVLQYIEDEQKITELKEMYYNNSEIEDEKLLKKGINIDKIVDLLIEWGKKYDIRLESDIKKGRIILKDIEDLKEIKSVKTQGKKLNEIGKLNEEFIDAVMSNIPKGLSKECLARAIYIELNKRVKFNETFSFYDQDLSLDFINKIYNMDRNKVTKENNKITCKSWSEIYADLLGMNEIQSYIVGEKHKYVKFFLNGEIFTADATNEFTARKVENSEIKNDSMNDLARAKYGIKPEGFFCENNIDFDFSEIDKTLGYGFRPTRLKEEIKVVLEDFKCDMNKTKENSDEIESLLELITMIEEKNKGFDAVGIEKYKYYDSIEEILKEYKDIIQTISPRIYIKNNADEYEVVTTIRLEENENILINSVDGVVKISKSELMKEVEKGKYLEFQSRKTEKSNSNKDDLDMEKS